MTYVWSRELERCALLLALLELRALRATWRARTGVETRAPMSFGAR